MGNRSETQPKHKKPEEKQRKLKRNTKGVGLIKIWLTYIPEKDPKLKHTATRFLLKPFFLHFSAVSQPFLFCFFLFCSCVSLLFSFCLSFLALIRYSFFIDECLMLFQYGYSPCFGIGTPCS